MSSQSTETESPSTAQMQAALEHALIGVCVLDARALTARWCNTAFRRFVPDALRDDAVEARHARELVPRFDEHGYEEIFRLVSDSGRPFVNLEDEHSEAGGERTYWRWSVTALPPDGLMIQAVEVTEQVAHRRQAAAARAAENAARQQSARIEAILDSTDEGIVVGDMSGNVLYMNPAARRIHGYGPGDKPEKNLSDFARRFELRNPADGQVLAMEQWPLARVLRGEQFSGYELLVRRLDVKHEVVVDYSGSTVVPHGARGTVVILGVRDVTARKQVERELEGARHQAEAASRAKDEFLAVLSHELRTPLTPVLTAAQAMESDPEVDEALRVTAGMIRRNVELEARLIDDLLDLTRISRGKLRLDFTRTDVHEKVQNVVEILADDARSKGVQIIVSLAARRRYVRGDPARLQQVVWNLLKNAIKFTPEGGRITVSTSDNVDGQILFEVIDTGIGIHPEILPKIFDAFEQGSGEVTRQFGGLGLGLAITRVLVQLHGGAISAESGGAGRGSRFAVRLPVVGEPSHASPSTRLKGDGGTGSGLTHAAGSGLANVVGSGLSNFAGSGLYDAACGSSGLAAAATEAAHASRRNRRRILLVEDHDDTAKIMTSVLRHQGHTVRRAASVAAALQAAQAERFDLLISDIGLPDGSGLDLMRQLRLRHPVRGIALSGFGMDEDVQRSRAAGFDEHLTKPVSLDVLETTIKRVSES